MTRTRKSAWAYAALAPLALAALLGTGPSFAQQAQPAVRVPQTAPAGGGLRQNIEAIVNDQVITTYDVRQRMGLIVGMSRIRPTPETLPQIQQQALYSLIDDTIRLQELRHQEKERKTDQIVADDREVDQAFESTARQNNMTPAEYTRLLASWGVDVKSERERLRTERSWGFWIGGFYGRRIRISPDEVDAYLARLEEDQSKPAYEIAEIFIDANRAGGIQRANELAAQLINQLQQGTPFQAVATQFSGRPSAANGGEAGWLSAGQLPPEVERVVEQIRPGQLSRPIPVSDGVYLIYLKDKRSGSNTPVVNLKQVATMVPSDASAAEVQAARTRLMGLKGRITSCETLESVAQGVEGVVAGPLGEAEVKDLAAPFREAAERLAINQVSDPIRTDVGLHLVAVCGRRNASATLPSREDVKRRMENERLEMVSKREILKLRNAATIEQR